MLGPSLTQPKIYGHSFMVRDNSHLQLQSDIEEKDNQPSLQLERKKMLS